MTQPSLMTRPLALGPAPVAETPADEAPDATLLASLADASGPDLIALLFRFDLAEPFLRQLKERVVVSQRDDLSAPEAIAKEALSQYCSEHNLSSDEERQRWCLVRGMGPDDFLAEAIHEWRRGELRSKLITTSGESLYLRYKDKLDRVGIMANPLEYHSPKLPGLGDVNWRKFFAALTDVRYRGPVCIEVEDKAYEGSIEDVKSAILTSRNYLRQFLG